MWIEFLESLVVCLRCVFGGEADGASTATSCWDVGDLGLLVGHDADEESGEVDEGKLHRDL